MLAPEPSPMYRFNTNLHFWGARKECACGDERQHCKPPQASWSVCHTVFIPSCLQGQKSIPLPINVATNTKHVGVVFSHCTHHIVRWHVCNQIKAAQHYCWACNASIGGNPESCLSVLLPQINSESECLQSTSLHGSHTETEQVLQCRKQL